MQTQDEAIMVANNPNEVDNTRELTALRSTSLPGADCPVQVLLAPWGRVESTNGSFLVDEESARLVQEAFQKHGTDLPIDYEHQTLGGAYSSPNGQAPAAGWIKRIFAKSNIGLLADIEWTDQGRRMLATKQYRYLSPVAIIRKADRKLVAMHSAALTNKPAIVGMQPIVNRADSTTHGAGQDALTVLRTELNLASNTAVDEVLLSAGRKLIDLQREAIERKVEERVREAIHAGKLVEAQRAWAEAMVAREEDLFDDWLRTAPVVVTRGSTPAPPLPCLRDRRLEAVAAQAHAEFVDNPLLSGLTTLEAYVADARRLAEHTRAV